MQDGPSLQALSDFVLPPPDSPIHRALVVQKLIVELADNYVGLMNTVFQRPCPGVDKKQLIAYRNCLLGAEASDLLHIIWKESEFVSEAALIQMGISRSFTPTSLTAHGLAVEICRQSDDPAGELAKTISQVRTVIISGAAYGLIERLKTPNKTILKATHLLHNFIINLQTDNMRSITNVPLISSLIYFNSGLTTLGRSE